MQKEQKCIRMTERKQSKVKCRKWYSWNWILVSALLVFSLIFGMIPVQVLEDVSIAGKVEAAKRDVAENMENVTLKNPRVENYVFKETRYVMEWDCIYFGSYPQAEVVPSGEYVAIGNEYLQEGDIIVDDSLYASLQNAVGWDKKGDVVLEGKKYRRIRREEIDNGSSGYRWSDNEVYHYFKYEPIRWRVLNVDGNKALLLSDQVLDCQRYYDASEGATWEKSMVRSFLNGYGVATENSKWKDYVSVRSFLGTAFDGESQEALEDTNVTQNDSIYNTSESARGNNTVDKIFLLSDSDVYGTEQAESFGFSCDQFEYDEAKECRCSTYAKAMGTSWFGYKGNCWWFLRSPGDNSPGDNYDKTLSISDFGRVQSYHAAYIYDGIRPSVVLNLLCSNLYSYAGTVTSDGITDRKKTGLLENPRVVKQENQEEQERSRMTWDCLFLGSYPQAEIVTSGGIVGIRYCYIQEGDIIIDDNLYTALQNVEGWDEKGDIVLDGERYRRIRKEDALYVASQRYGSQYYWTDSEDYHYFKYEPIKWRVLNVDGGKALLLADWVLDNQQYNTVNEDITWEKSTIRSFLNSYGATENQQGVDYVSGRSFLETAFGNENRKGLEDTTVTQSDSLGNTSESARGRDTSDKVFLLSDSEVYGTDKAESYGFARDRNKEDEARRCKSSIYAKAMGTLLQTKSVYRGDCGWYLRSPGSDSNCVMDVNSFGNIYSGDYYVSITNGGLRPAVVLNLKYTDLYAYAGVVHSDGSTEPGTIVDSQEEHIHNFENNWIFDAANHWKECTCGEKSDFSAHTFKWITDKAATVSETGLKHEECTVCGHQRNGNTVIAKLTNDVENQQGNEKPVQQKTDIAGASVKGLKVRYIFTGKAIAPSISLMLDGKSIAAADVTIQYKNNKAVGIATVTITGKNTYTGTLTKSFSIVPKGTAISKLAAGKKKMTIKWKKQASQTDGYEISYSLKKNMKSAKTVTIKKAKTTSKTVKKLKSKTTYYVRIRTYKKVGKKTYVSAWSGVKSVKIK